MQPWFSFVSYVKYLLRAKGPDSLHSPFVFRFYCDVLRNPYNFYAFETIEDQRQRLLANREEIRFFSLGARQKEVRCRVGEMAAKSLLPTEKAMFLFQLAYWLRPAVVIELGTCMGISTAYLASAHPSRVVSFEGIKALSDIAKGVWHNLGLSNIELMEGDIDQTLPAFAQMEKAEADLIFVDANHTREATLRYFRTLKTKASPQACMVFDDIYWSEEMASAWEEIKADPEVTVSIDLYHLGLVFFRKESPKENFIIRW